MAGLTKQHFKAIAAILNRGKQSQIFIINESSADLKALCNYFKTQNPQFDEAKFMEAVLK